MQEETGFIIINDEPNRAYHIEHEAMDVGGGRDPDQGLYRIWLSNFSDTVSGVDWNFRKLDMCLLSFDGKTLTYAALARRGRKVATAKYQIKYTHLVKFSPITFERITEQISAGFRAHIVRTSRGDGSRVPPATWRALLRALSQVDPLARKAIEELQRLRDLSEQRLNGRGYTVMALEKDAVSLALECSGLGRYREQLAWTPVDQGPAPFLKGLRSVPIREDGIIAHDANVFGDWTREAANPISTEFRSGLDRLTIMNVNRTPIEQTLGVDLVYYHHIFRSFVMVQYKRMTDIGGSGEPSYRPTEKSYQREVERMRAFSEANWDRDQRESRPEDYRLHDGAFYFKFCSSVLFAPLATTMLPGMYFPLDYWGILESSGSIRGPKGGTVITPSNTGRHLSTTIFTDLVKHGFVGTRLNVSRSLEETIRTLLEGRHSVICAARTEDDSIITDEMWESFESDYRSEWPSDPGPNFGNMDSWPGEDEK